jgi:hypothetical protein
MSLQQHDDAETPKAWVWGDDGNTITGTYIGVDSAVTAFSEGTPVPILILNVDGSPRSVWAFESVLRNKIAEELGKRPTRTFNEGEQITITRSAEKVKPKGGGNGYWGYNVRFADSPTQHAGDVFGVTPQLSTPELPPAPAELEPEPGDDDSIPF